MVGMQPRTPFVSAGIAAGCVLSGVNMNFMYSGVTPGGSCCCAEIRTLASASVVTTATRATVKNRLGIKVIMEPFSSARRAIPQHASLGDRDDHPEKRRWKIMNG